MKVFFNLILIQTILNIYIFFKGWCIIPTRNHRLRSIYIAVFAFEILTYAVAFIWNDSFNLKGYSILLTLCSWWSFFIFYMALTLLSISLLRWLYRLIARVLKKEISKETSLAFRRTSFIFSLTVACTVLISGFYNFKHPVINNKEISIQKNVKSDFSKTLKIVMFSDLHLGYINGSKCMEQYIDLVMRQNADLILIAGDIIDYTLKPVLEDNITKQFERLKAPLGVYTCLGNHDHYADAQDKIKWLKEESGITVLQDSVVFVDSTFYIVGREEFKSPRKQLKDLLVDTDPQYPIFVLNHQPNYLEEEVSANVDIALYGHTHDGQIFPFTHILRAWYDLSAGYKKLNNTHIFVSSGLGGIPQFRIGSESEIIVVNCTLTKKEN